MKNTHVLNIENPDYLVWKYEELQFDILGGIQLEGLERLRVTIRATYNDITIRHNLDMYNDNQLTQLVRKCTERFEMSSSYLTPIIGELINQLEDYRLKQIKSETDKEPKKKELTKSEAESATQLLKSKNLLSKINELIGKAGVIGEEDNRLLMYIIFTSRLMDNPLQIISMGASGTGKSHLQESVAQLIPEEDRMSITDLSESSFYYFERYTLSHKLILIEDLDGASHALYPLRELQSKKSITKTFVEKTKHGFKTNSRTVDGPVCVAGCTTKEHIYEDNSNRSFLIYIDNSVDQDLKIMEYQRLLSANSFNTNEKDETTQLLKNSQRLLKPVKVINPFAEFLILPQSVFKPRRTNSHYLHFIEAVTFLHQFQREIKKDSKTGVEYVETTIEDIENANELLKDVLLKKSDRLTPACRRYFEKLKLYLIGEDQLNEGFTNADISQAFKESLTTIKRNHLSLVDNGYLKTQQKIGSKTLFYQIVSYEEYQALQSAIATALDKSLKALKQTTKATKRKSPKRAQSKNGLNK